jgi:hypothetical protein
MATVAMPVRFMSSWSAQLGDKSISSDRLTGPIGDLRLSIAHCSNCHPHQGMQRQGAVRGGRVNRVSRSPLAVRRPR